MNAKEIKECLKDLVGKEFKSYCFGSEIAQAIRPVLNSKYGIDFFEGARPLSYDTERQIMNITYQGRGVGEIQVKKAKGRKHYSYFGSHCDWTITDFSVIIYSSDGNLLETNTIENRLNEIDEAVARETAAKNARTLELAEAVKALMAATGKDFREVINIMQEVNKFRYSSNFEKLCLQEA